MGYLRSLCVACTLPSLHLVSVVFGTAISTSFNIFRKCFLILLSNVDRLTHTSDQRTPQETTHTLVFMSLHEDINMFSCQNWWYWWTSGHVLGYPFWNPGKHWLSPCSWSEGRFRLLTWSSKTSNQMQTWGSLLFICRIRNIICSSDISKTEGICSQRCFSWDATNSWSDFLFPDGLITSETAFWILGSASKHPHSTA